MDEAQNGAPAQETPQPDAGQQDQPVDAPQADGAADSPAPAAEPDPVSKRFDELNSKLTAMEEERAAVMERLAMSEQSARDLLALYRTAVGGKEQPQAQTKQPDDLHLDERERKMLEAAQSQLEAKVAQPLNQKFDAIQKGYADMQRQRDIESFRSKWVASPLAQEYPIEAIAPDIEKAYKAIAPKGAFDPNMESNLINAALMVVGRKQLESRVSQRDEQAKRAVKKNETKRDGDVLSTSSASGRPAAKSGQESAKQLSPEQQLARMVADQYLAATGTAGD